MEFFLCFSLLRNSRAVFKTDVTPETVTSLFGLRVLSIFWIILAHVYVYSKSVGGITGKYMTPRGTQFMRYFATYKVHKHKGFEVVFLC